MLGACDLWHEDAVKPVDAEGVVVEGPRFAYRTEISGVEDGALRTILTETSRLVSLQSRPPATVAGLRQRAAEDVARLEEALRSEGYYASRTSFRIDESASPALVLVEVEPGPRYRLESYAVTPTAPVPGAAFDPTSLGVEIGAPARAPEVVAAESRLLAELAEEGRPKARILDRRVVVDHEAATMTVTVQVDPGAPARFGPVTITGLRDVREDHVRRMIPWREGEPFDQRKIEELRAAFGKSGLFESASIMPADSVGPDGELPIALAFVERPFRSIGGGLSYSTSEGTAVEGFWEHRNLFGRGERLQATALVSTITQSVVTDLRKPYFLRPDQTLIANITARAQDTDAYQERTLSSSLGVEREISTHWRAAGAVSVEWTETDDDSGNRTFFLVGLPLSARRDTTDDLLDPTRGSRLRFDVTPYVGTGDESLMFVRTEASGSTYLRMTGDDSIVLAGRARIGSILGESTVALPATKRFYAGGGGSIRGFEYQRVGPLDASEDPLGGRSLIELGVELRFRITESIGLVPFIDAGNVYDSSLPDFKEELRYAGGLGFRYFTPIGPLRLDIAFPINRRKDIDDLFQFYISLGQAF